MQEEEHNLKSGSILQNYTIIRVLGEGGFGITYLAKDNDLGTEVVIKEYFPNEFAMRSNDSTITAKSKSIGDYAKGMQRFKEEAQTLAKFNHPSIVKILGYFEANNTAYFVMEYEEGIDLSQYLKQKGKLGQEEILSIMMPILEGLKEVHAANFLHRDIKPGNILLRTNKTPVLIDFGASKLAIGEASKSITSMLTEGYAPLEQYSTDIKQQGAFTDLYAIAAVIYKCIIGDVPPSAQTRSYALLQDDPDPYESLMSLSLKGYDENFLKAVDRALSMKARNRPQNVQEFQEDIAGRLVHKEETIKTEETPRVKNNNGLLMGLGVLIVLAVGVLAYLLGNNGNGLSVIEPTSTQKVVEDNRSKVKDGKSHKDTAQEIEAGRKKAEEETKKYLEAAEQARKEAEKANKQPVVPVPKITKEVWDLVKAKNLVYEKLKRYGNATAYGFADIVKQHGNIAMKHNIFASYDFTQSGVEHYLLVANSTTEQYNDYRASASKLSFFVFTRENGKWILDYDHIAVKEYGHFGQPPGKGDARLLQVGVNQFVLELRNSMSTQGYGESYAVLYLIERAEMKTIFSEQIEGNNGGTMNPDTDWKATLQLSTQGNILYDLTMHVKGQKEGKRVGKKIIYRYDGDKYVKVQSKASPVVPQTTSSVTSCTYFTVSYEVKQLNIRNKPGKPSKIVGRVNKGDRVCIYEFNGKWGRSDSGWISRKYLDKDYEKNNFLLADVDNDGKNERLEWKCFSGCKSEDQYYQLKLYNDDGSLLWSGSRKTGYGVSLVGTVDSTMGTYFPVILNDIDGDGNVELIMAGEPHEPVSPGFSVFKWTGKEFKKMKNADLVWIDAPNGRTLKWKNIDSAEYGKSKKMWWAYGFEQSLNEEFPIVTIEGVKYPESMPFSNTKAKIRFTPTGAVIEEWIK